MSAVFKRVNGTCQLQLLIVRQVQLQSYLLYYDANRFL